MRTNSFKCKNCGEYTRHVEISLREAASIRTADDDGEPTAQRVLNGLWRIEAGAADFFGGRLIAKDIVGFTPYKCSKCGRCAWRNSGGEEKEFLGYSK